MARALPGSAGVPQHGERAERDQRALQLHGPGVVPPAHPLGRHLARPGRGASGAEGRARQCAATVRAALQCAAPPTFAEYFSRLGVRGRIGAAFELQGQSYRSVESGDRLRPTAAYWVFPDQTIPAPDPLRVRSGVGGLRFDPQTSLQELVLDVGASDGAGGGAADPARALRLRVSPSTGNPSSTDWLELEQADGSFAAVGAETLLEIAPEQSIVRLTFRARREGVAVAGGANPAAVIDVVSREGTVTLGAELEVPGLKGIWIGNASITEVERPSFYGGGFAPAPPVSAALILEIPSTGPARLLPCVTVQSGRDGRSVSYRLEAALVHETIPLAGTVAADGTSGNLVATSVMSSSHPLNPYRHRYHPEHGSGYDITRSFRLRLGEVLPGQPPTSDLNPFSHARGAPRSLRGRDPRARPGADSRARDLSTAPPDLRLADAVLGLKRSFCESYRR